MIIFEYINSGTQKVNFFVDELLSSNLLITINTSQMYKELNREEIICECKFQLNKNEAIVFLSTLNFISSVSIDASVKLFFKQNGGGEYYLIINKKVSTYKVSIGGNRLDFAVQEIKLIPQSITIDVDLFERLIKHTEKVIYDPFDELF